MAGATHVPPNVKEVLKIKEKGYMNTVLLAISGFLSDTYNWDSISWLQLGLGFSPREDKTGENRTDTHVQDVYPLFVNITTTVLVLSFQRLIYVQRGCVLPTGPSEKELLHTYHIGTLLSEQDLK